MKVKSFGMAWFHVTDLEKNKKLFKDVLGLTLEKSDPNFGWLEYSAGEGETKIGVGKYSEEYGPTVKPGQNAVLTFTVENIKEATEELKKKGVKLVGDPMEVPGHVILQSFVDEDENYFQLVEVLSHE